MAEYIFWGVIASPYQLKMQALADFAGHSWERWPDQASWFDAVRMAQRLKRAKKREQIQRLPARVAGFDEYPTVPFYTSDGKQFYYDSTGFAYHLDQHPQGHGYPLVPSDPQLRFVCQLIDEAFDEFGLYMAHHNRWVTSATTTPMGKVTGEELGKLYPFGIKHLIARSLPRRQVRRCPYLFSVASPDFDAGVAPSLTPPAREGFPATHQLLDTAWRQYLGAMEQLLLQQPYLLGDRFTLADASAYGQLSMNLIDGVAADLLAGLAPTTWRWLCGIRDEEHKAGRGELYLSDSLLPLLAVIADTFIPLMQQNATAYRRAVEQGEESFNEAAFNQGRALYDGTLMGKPFRAVAKSFQVPVWMDLCGAWQALEQPGREQLSARYPVINDEAFEIS